MWIRLIPSGVLANDMRFWSSCDYDVARQPSCCSIPSLGPRRQMLQLCPGKRFLRYGGRHLRILGADGHAKSADRAVLSGDASWEPHLVITASVFPEHRANEPMATDGECSLLLIVSAD